MGDSMVSLGHRPLEGSLQLSAGGKSVLRAQIPEKKADAACLALQYDAQLANLAALFCNIFSPIQCIPSETLSEIFEHVCSDYGSESDLDVPKLRIHKHPQLTLSHVCATWRRVAHATPRIWTTLHYKRRSLLRFTKECDIACEWLSRSGGLLLDLYLRVHDRSLLKTTTSTESKTALTRTCLASFFPYLSRIRTLSLHDTCGAFIAPLYELPVASMPSLEVVNLSIASLVGVPPPRESQPALPPRSNLFSGSPLLHTLSVVENESETSFLHRLALPGSQITSFDYRGSDLCCQTPRVYMDIIQTFRNLRHCSLSFPRIRIDDDAESDLDGAVILPVLESLHLSLSTVGSTSEHVLFFVANLTAPSLTRLKLDGLHTSYHDRLARKLLAFRERSGCLLSSLDLSNVIPGQSIDFLRVFDTIRVLKVSNIISDALPLVQSLILKPECCRGRGADGLGQPAMLVPKLQVLHLALCIKQDDEDEEDFSENLVCSNGSVADMIESRWWLDRGDEGVLSSPTTCEYSEEHRARLKQVVFNDVYPRALGTRTRERLEVCRERGLDLTIRELGHITFDYH